jgi:hypothetical protein
MEITCPHCQGLISVDHGDEFCPDCGQPIQGGAPPAPSANPAPDGADPAAILNPAAEGAAPAATDPATVAAEVSAPTLLLLVDGRAPVPYLGKPLLVGRTDEPTGVFPDVPFNDPAISRRHLTVWMEGERILAQDGSLNGTFRGSERLPAGVPAEVQPGEILTIHGERGTYSIRIKTTP